MHRYFSRKTLNAIKVTFSYPKRAPGEIGVWTRTLFSASEVDSFDFPRLSRQQVTTYLRTHEASYEVNDGPIKSFETNKLAANQPIEDRSTEGKLKIPHVSASQYLFGIFDGHAGCACAQVVSERLLSYIAVMLSPSKTLENIIAGHVDPCDDLLYRFPHWDFYYSSDMAALYKKSLRKLARELLTAPNDDATIEELLQAAYMRLDHDVLNDAMPGTASSALELETLQLAFAGSCAITAFVQGTDLYVANAGDSQAVLGMQTEDGNWEPVELSKMHTAENHDEVTRIINQHPNEGAKLFRGGRLLGDLAPLRAFGDARYKIPERIMKHIINTGKPMVLSIYGDHLIPNGYKTPPYLTAEPEVIHHPLSPRDKFLVLASDGLWEQLDPKQVVNLVAGHMDGKQVLHSDFVLPQNDLTMKEINDLLIVRKSKLAKKPLDQNVTSHLLRMALGPEHGKLSHYLSLPDVVVRQYRDDISITVIYFDTDYISKEAYHQG